MKTIDSANEFFCLLCVSIALSIVHLWEWREGFPIFDMSTEKNLDTHKN